MCLGIREDGRLWTLGIRGTHVLVVGSTGSGKASVLHSLTRGLAPSIRAGLVEAWGFDPKGGMELAIGRPLFARLFTGTPESMADALEDCAGLVTERAESLSRTRDVLRRPDAFGRPTSDQRDRAYYRHHPRVYGRLRRCSR